MKKETFETELWDLITPNQREIVQSIIAYLSAEEADETEETVQKIQTNNSSIIQSISTPGYSIEFTSNPDSLGEHEKPKGIDKQGVLLEVLTERFQINRKKIYIFEEGKQQEHLNTKYSSYYVEIEGKGLVIIINNEYGQALRIKAIEPIQEEHKIVETIKTLIENKTKKQLDEDLEFITHNNTYDSTDALKALYVRIIEGEIRRESQIVEKVEKVETVETELKLTGSAAEIWNQIKGKEIINGKHSKKLNNIIDLLEMGVNYFLRGKIGNTQARDIINAILGLEGEDKIKISNNDQKTIKKSKDEIEKARTLLKVKVKAGGLGLEAKEEYEKHLEDKIELTGSAEEIWEQIKGKVIKYVRKTKKLNSIIDLLELNPTSITMGKIGETHVREIINVMLELDGDKKITWHTKKPEIIENKNKDE